uniref:Uncharacterized protein n=1 Tax=Anopheles stephensi TaxID=30069 RepID=A0A182Y1S8_ANOST
MASSIQAPSTNRICTRDYVVRNEDGVEFIIDKARNVFIHNDPQYYPDPEKFDPERFSESNRDKIHETVSGRTLS